MNQPTAQLACVPLLVLFVWESCTTRGVLGFGKPEFSGKLVTIYHCHMGCSFVHRSQVEGPAGISSSAENWYFAALNPDGPTQAFSTGLKTSQSQCVGARNLFCGGQPVGFACMCYVWNSCVVIWVHCSLNWVARLICPSVLVRMITEHCVVEITLVWEFIFLSQLFLRKFSLPLILGYRMDSYLLQGGLAPRTLHRSNRLSGSEPGRLPSNLCFTCLVPIVWWNGGAW